MKKTMNSVGGAEELLTALDPQQQQVAMQVRGPLCVRAGAGTGKTRAITYRIAYAVASGQVEPNSILAVTFTSRAAAEMRSRLRGLGVPAVQARTFHSAALRQLTYFWGRTFGGDRPQIIPQKASLVSAAAARIGLSVDKTLVRDLASEIEWSKVSMVGPDSYQERARQAGRPLPGDITIEDFLRVLDGYEQAKSERNVMDFEDALTLTSAIMLENEDIAQQIRRQYSYFVVDEYQDVSPLQQQMLDMWVGNRRDLCVVGDVAQTIYSFAGATPSYLTKFEERFPEGRTVELNRDYRSTPQVVAVANQIVAHARGLEGVGEPRGLEGSVRLVSQREGGPAVRFVAYPTDEDQAQGVAEAIAKLREGGESLADIAILYRTNSQSEAFEQALTARGMGVQVHGGARFFEREEIRKAVVLLRQSARLQTLVGADGGKETDLVSAVENVALSLGWSSTDGGGPASTGAVRDRWENLDALVTMARASAHLTLDQFVAELQERAEAQAAPEVNGVVLSTLHAAKGLEWKNVFIVGASEGLLPISRAELPATIEEERRLLYVGVTRARNRLQISYARSRSGGRSATRRVSRFLEPLWPEEEKRPARTVKAATVRQQLKGDAERFEQQADADTKKLFATLKDWRLRQARATSKPAFTIMNDVTLRDIATAKPKTLRQLGALRGIGAGRLADFGAEILQMVRAGQEDD